MPQKYYSTARHDVGFAAHEEVQRRLAAQGVQLQPTGHWDYYNFFLSPSILVESRSRNIFTSSGQVRYPTLFVPATKIDYARNNPAFHCTLAWHSPDLKFVCWLDDVRAHLLSLIFEADYRDPVRDQVEDVYHVPTVLCSSGWGGLVGALMRAQSAAVAAGGVVVQPDVTIGPEDDDFFET